MAAVSLAPIWNGFQFFSNSGAPLAGGFVGTFVAGSTTTKQATYTSASGATQNPNPIQLDAHGRLPAELWLVDGSSYNLVLYSVDGVTILQSCDNISRGVAPTAYVKVAGDTMTGTLVSPGLTLTGPVTAGGLAGTAGQVLTSTGTGVAWGAASNFVVNPQTGTSYNTVLGDANNIITTNNAAANTIVIEPLAYNVGTIINFIQLGAGQTTVSGGAGVTVQGASGTATRAQYSCGTACQVSTNVWVLTGDLATPTVVTG